MPPIRIGWISYAFLLTATAAAVNSKGFKSPEELALSADRSSLYATCMESGELAIIDLAQPGIATFLPVGRMPRGIVVDPTTHLVYVANSWDDTISVVDPRSRRQIRTLRTGSEPIGLAIDVKRKRLFSMNRLSGDVAVHDLEAGTLLASIPIGKGASYGTLAQGKLLVSRIYPTIRQDGTAILNSITPINLGTLQAEPAISVEGLGAAYKIAAPPTGSWAIAASIFPRNFLPTSHVDGGGLLVNGLTLLSRTSVTAIAVPLDSLTFSLAQPFDVILSPRNDAAFVSISGADQIAVLDLRALLLSASSRAGTQKAFTDLLATSRLMRKQVPVGRNPRGMALDGPQSKLYVANRLDDTISILDSRTLDSIGSIALTNNHSLTPERRGAQLFHTSRFTRVRQFSCASCHIDNLTDGLSWDLEQDGFGADIVATKSLESLKLTAPFKWSGVTPDLATECGTLSERYFFRSEGFRGSALQDLVAYLESIPTRPNRFRKPGGLTPLQIEGKRIFERKKTNDGRDILFVLQCLACHVGPAHTVNTSTSVGTRTKFDRTGAFDTPGLINTGYNVNFLHDGSALNLFELWTKFNTHDLHGVTSDLTPRQLEALVEYLRTL